MSRSRPASLRLSPLLPALLALAASAAAAAAAAPPGSFVGGGGGAAPTPRVARFAAIVQRVFGERCSGVVVTASNGSSGFVCGGGGGGGGGGDNARGAGAAGAFVLVLRVNATALARQAFAIVSCADADGGVLIEGGDELGLLFGAGKFLHTSDFSPAPAAFAPSTWRGEDAPVSAAMRAVYFATHFNNFFVEAPPAITAAYVEDLALWGLNTVIVTVPIQQFTGVSDPAFSALITLLRTLFASAADVGLSVGLIHVVNQGFSTRPVSVSYTPFPDPQGVRGHLGFLTCAGVSGHDYLTTLSAEMLGAFDALDTIIFWPYDEGGCGCGADWPWGAKGFPRISAAVLVDARSRFPALQAVLSTWMFDQPAAGEFDGLDAYLHGDGAGLFSATMADNHADLWVP